MKHAFVSPRQSVGRIALDLQPRHLSQHQIWLDAKLPGYKPKHARKAHVQSHAPMQCAGCGWRPDGLHGRGCPVAQRQKRRAKK